MTTKAGTKPKFHELPKEVVRVSMPVAVSRKAKAQTAAAGVKLPQYFTALACRDLGLDPSEFGLDPAPATN